MKTSALLKIVQLASFLSIGATSCQKEPVDSITGKWQIASLGAASAPSSSVQPLEALALSAVSQNELSLMQPAYIRITDHTLTLFTQANDSTALAYTTTSREGSTILLKTKQGEGRLKQITPDNARLSIAGATYELTRTKQ